MWNFNERYSVNKSSRGRSGDKRKLSNNTSDCTSEVNDMVRNLRNYEDDNNYK